MQHGNAATRVEAAATSSRASSRSALPSRFVRTRTGVASPVALLTGETVARVRVERWRMRVERVVDIYRHCQYVTFLQMLILASRACARSHARTHTHAGQRCWRRGGWCRNQMHAHTHTNTCTIHAQYTHTHTHNTHTSHTCAHNTHKQHTHITHIARNTCWQKLSKPRGWKEGSAA